VLSIVLQDTLHLSALDTGLWILPSGGTAVFGAGALFPGMLTSALIPNTAAPAASGAPAPGRQPESANGLPRTPRPSRRNNR
jgi:hypothetical protein